MKNNIYGKGINKKIWHSIYTNKVTIDIFNMLTEDNFRTLTKLGFIIENRLYTEQEFDTLKFELLKFYKTNRNDEIIQTEILSSLNVKKEEYLKILNILNKIDKKYDL